MSSCGVHFQTDGTLLVTLAVSLKRRSMLHISEILLGEKYQVSRKLPGEPLFKTVQLGLLTLCLQQGTLPHALALHLIDMCNIIHQDERWRFSSLSSIIPTVAQREREINPDLANHLAERCCFCF